MPGPTIRAALIMEEFKAIALDKSSMVDQLIDHRLPRRHVQGADNPEHDSQQNNVDRLHPTCEGQCGKQGRLNESCGLCPQHNAMGRIAIRQHAANGTERENGNLRGEADDAKQGRRPGEPIDQPALRHLLHPGAADRDQLGGKI